MLVCVLGLVACGERREPDSPLPPAPVRSGELEPIADLRSGTRQERPLSGGERHAYALDLEEDELVTVAVKQRGIDVVVTLFAPDGDTLRQVDRPIGSAGEEDLVALIAEGGSHVLVVEAFDGSGSGGGYDLAVDAHPATAVDRIRDAASQAFFQGQSALEGGSVAAALDHFRRARDLWRQAADSFGQGESLYAVGQCHEELDDWVRAEASYGEAVKLFHQAGEPRWEAATLTVLGRGFFVRDDLDRAIDHHRRALALWRLLGYRVGEARTSHNLGQAYQVQGEIDQALRHYDRALALWRRDPYRADTLHNLGVLYRWLGQDERARECLEESQSLYARSNDPFQAASLNQLGRLERERGELDLALDYHLRALALGRDNGDRRAAALSELGQIHELQGRLSQAGEHYDEALVALRGLNRKRSTAKVLQYRGQLLTRLGEPARAIESYLEALDLQREVGDPSQEAETLTRLARAYRGRGRLDLAREASAKALDIVESLRVTSRLQDLRTSYFATVQPLFEAHVDLLMASHDQDPGAGYGARALHTSERARHRSLLDLLSEARAEIHSGLDSELRRRQVQLESALRRDEGRRLQLLDLVGSGVTGEGRISRRLAAVEASMRQGLSRLDALRAEVRAKSPRYAALAQPRLLQAQEIQGLLDPETQLLIYQLGAARSYLWVVAPDSLESFVLAPRRDIEAASRRAHASLSAGYRWARREGVKRALCDLARYVLEPAAAALTARRLVVVPDGALHYVPFAALPLAQGGEPCRDAPPLVEGHETSRLPSASVLALLRRQVEPRPAPSRLVAVVADPVLTSRDERLGDPAATGEEGTADRGAPWRAVQDLPRLPHARREAEAILALVPARERALLAVDFDANKDTVKRQLLDSRILHFATHGRLDGPYPELWGLVLSAFDAQGRPRDPFLRSYEIYNLRLSADLVVLSACETALGREVRGEGLVGLTRGFMYAGAPRVLVSLWKVADESTAHLMQHFYRALLQEKETPAVALATAQRALRDEGRFRAPYHWAGFVLQGEWR